MVLLAGAAAAEEPGGRGPLARHPAPSPAPTPVLSVPLPLDRQPVPLPPAYERPSAGFVPLPSGGSALSFANPPSAGTNHVWVPSRTEVVIGIDRRGRIIYTQEYIPGRFGR